MAHDELLALLQNAAKLLIPLFGHRFPKLGSLQFVPEAPPPAPSHPQHPSAHRTSSEATITPGMLGNMKSPSLLTPQLSMSSTLVPPTPTATAPSKGIEHLSFPTLPPSASPPPQIDDIAVGPIVSWPFFGSGRGLLAHPQELERGPWPTEGAYLRACAQREVAGVIRENEGKAVPHRLHLDPDEIQSSRHPHHLRALEDEDESEASTEWDWEESEQEWEGPGDNMYRDYRRMQRGTFLLSHMQEREQKVREEMERFLKVMGRLGAKTEDEGGGGDGGGGPAEEFALDCHDLSLENVFVDEHDHSKIVSGISHIGNVVSDRAL
jgi:hypothetical protein